MILQDIGTAIQTLYTTTANLAWGSTPSRSVVEFKGNAYLFNGNVLMSIDAYLSSPSETTKSISNAIATDIIAHKDFVYYSYVYQTGNYSGKIGRFDGSTAITGAGASDAQISLEPNYSPVCMASWGDYNAILASEGASTTPWTDGQNVKLYIWDGISNTFDKIVTINDNAPQACYSMNGVLYIICAGFGRTIRLYGYTGGDSAELLWVYNVDDSNSIGVRKQTITSDGNFLYFAPYGLTNGKAYQYFYGGLSGKKVGGMAYTMETVATPGDISNIYAAANFADRGYVSFITDAASSKRTFKLSKSTTVPTSNCALRTPVFYAGEGSRVRIKRVRVRHTDISAADTITIALNPNAKNNPNTFTGTGDELVSKSGTATTNDGTEASIGEIRTYSFGYASNSSLPNTPTQLLDRFQFLIKYSPSGVARQRIILPIYVDGEIVTEPN